MNQELINIDFRDNKISTNSAIVAIINEYGNSLESYVNKNSIERQRFNTLPIKNSTSLKSEAFRQTTKAFNMLNWKSNSIFSDVAQSLIWFLNVRSGLFTSTDKVRETFLPLFIVNSQSGSAAWITGNVNSRSELFAQALARWIGTKNNERDYAWELLNDYFISFSPRNYNL